CVGPCADLANVHIGPDVWLPAAVRRASEISGVRAFINTGPGVGRGLGSSLIPADFAREQAHYARRLGVGPGSLPVFTAASHSDGDAGARLDAFQAAFSGFGAPLGRAPPAPGITPAESAASTGSGGYAFDSSGPAGTVRVVVLDMSGAVVGDAQRCWLAQRLSEAAESRTPPIGVGQRDLTTAQGAGNATGDGTGMVATLVLGQPPQGCVLPSRLVAGASAYFFDYPEQNRTYPIALGGRSIPTFGSGTLGYVSAQD